MKKMLHLINPARAAAPDKVGGQAQAERVHQPQLLDGGLELPPMVVQERLGHANITMTLDTYGHLFPRGDDGRE
jgi:hypothetical protein